MSTDQNNDTDAGSSSAVAESCAQAQVELPNGNYLRIDDRSQIESAINGALQDAINQHGDIDHQTRASAAKRVYGALKQLAKDAEGWTKY